MFKILSEDKCNFTKDFSKEEFKIFRQRAIGLILATDMANHATELSAITSKLASNNIIDGENIEKLVGDDIDEKQVFRNQQ